MRICSFGFGLGFVLNLWFVWLDINSWSQTHDFLAARPLQLNLGFIDLDQPGIADLPAKLNRLTIDDG